MTNYPNWFASVRVNFEKYLEEYKGKPDLKFCQIGVFTGDASVWLVENILTDESSLLYDVDIWTGSPDEDIHMAMNWKDVEATYDAKVKSYFNIIKRKMSSQDWFNTTMPNSFDFIYIDGDHTSAEVLHDAVNSWRALKRGGVLAFDDYTWGDALADQRDRKSTRLNSSH